MSRPGPLSSFFEQYPDFDYDDFEPATSEFRRLSQQNGWTRLHPEQNAAYRAFTDALANQFNSNYGEDAGNLESWQSLCENLGIKPVPDDLAEARRVGQVFVLSQLKDNQISLSTSWCCNLQAVFNTHVNLVDLTEGFDGARKIEVFSSEAALSRYTKKTGRYFSSSRAAGTLLKALLRNIEDPPEVSSRRNEFEQNNPLLAYIARARHTQNAMPGPLQTFFDGFQPQFQYNPLQPATSEFRRLAQVQGWNTNDQQYRQAHRQFKDALVGQFNSNYGMDENSLTGWQALCEALGIEPIPDSVREAKKVRFFEQDLFSGSVPGLTVKGDPNLYILWVTGGCRSDKWAEHQNIQYGGAVEKVYEEVKESVPEAQCKGGRVAEAFA
ncbi:hypothetical protein EST38_g6206 [Candolleomyces aberdarensis]|uniref:Uncharacterized protein n=1 Tax=Candolleomyces aberdarensis TaxID=2316362 RepID=A0A4Q2DID3_9AGAR|nr:hypothetical protein EST38_g6206 [Candolleomyces aberdarensis]